MNGKIVALATAGMMLAGQAMAADARISSVSGAVLASQNGKFATATASTALKAGDRIVARNGTAQVTFADGCVVSVKPQAMLTVGASSPCVSGSGLVSATEGSTALLGMEDGGMTPALVTFLGLSAVLLVLNDSDVTISP